MSSATGFLVVVSLALALSSVHGSWWEAFEWSTEEPANCPHENTETHVCSSIQESNATCVSIKCCHEFEDDDDYAEYDEDAMSESEDDVYEIGQFLDWCSMCYSVKQCSVYRCHTRCCDGYERDHYGRCQNKTDHIECQNGGTPHRDYSGNYRCMCRHGFMGKSCEVPICDNCENGGECVVNNGRPYCNCSADYSGDHCTSSQCSLDCLNGGMCYKNGTREFCKCPYNYIGKLCENYFEQPENCPVPTTWHPYCGAYCMDDTGCGYGEICCREGCTTTCRKPKPDYCEYNGRHFRIGETHKPDVCTNCTCTASGEMMCIAMSCRAPVCSDGSDPVQKPDQCCPSCPNKPTTRPPIIYGCPEGVVFLNTEPMKDYAYLSTDVVHIRAFDGSTSQILPVHFSPRSVRHCRCSEPENAVTMVRAYVVDKYGNTASCNFRAVVLDNQQPGFTSCPEDIYVFEDEYVKWQKPTYYDNVGVARRNCTDKANGNKYDKGRWTVTYQIWDYDGNSAFCMFHVSVSERETDFEDLPQGLRDRSRDKDKNQIIIIVAPILGGLLLIVGLAVLLFLCCRRQHASSAATDTPARRAPAYDNNIYATPDDISVKLPPYSGLPMNPPAYSITSKDKDVTYLALAPPTYTNPGYETLGVHMNKSESVKSTKSETDPEKDPDPKV